MNTSTMLGLFVVLLCACTGPEPGGSVPSSAAPQAQAFTGTHGGEAASAKAIGTPIPSPSGHYSLVLVPSDRVIGGKSYRSFDFRILDSHGNKLFESKQEYAGWFRLWFAWDAQDRVWVGSEDVGLSWWEKTADGWEEHPYEEGGSLVPPVKQAIWVQR
jgi:hypothetical protein